ncbi:MAG: hypothetical protein D6732_16605 [Methanobacteriota archaeon]|nr:MAG: hypothetical protein D6732_16605 [Euryarchaeota archaeon]
MDSFLYIGVSPDKAEDAFPTFIGREMIPLAWFLLFRPEDAISRRTMLPESMRKPRKDLDLDQFARWQEEPVAFRTTLEKGLQNLSVFKEAFQEIPYIWSYFRVIDFIEFEIRKLIEEEEEFSIEELWENLPRGKPRRSNLSHVKVDEGEDKVKPTVSADNPFAELESLGGNIASAAPPSGASELGIPEDELLEVFSSLDELESLEGIFDATPEEQEEDDEIKKLERELESEEVEPKYVEVHFNDLLDWEKGITGKDFHQILVFFERLLHHVEREGRMTRVMLEILQDIFREGRSNWRLTGQLSEDFLRDNPNRLVDIMLGSPSPYIVLEETFDLEFWTNGTLQPGDERLMYALTLLPTEEVHKALDDGTFHEIAPSIRTILTNSAQIARVKFKIEDLRLPPKHSNLWGFRVLIRNQDGIRPATFLIPDPDQSWEEFFKDKLELPSVRQDWHINLQVRLSEYTDVDEFTIEFAGAKDQDEAFLAFARWIRRHQRLYRQKYGVEGTIDYMADYLLKTMDPALALKIFDTLNQLTEFGFSKAIEVLGNEKIIAKITSLYS